VTFSCCALGFRNRLFQFIHTVVHHEGHEVHEGTFKSFYNIFLRFVFFVVFKNAPFNASKFHTSSSGANLEWGYLNFHNNLNCLFYLMTDAPKCLAEKPTTDGPLALPTLIEKRLTSLGR
jgi:hypothetical protein